MNDIVPRKEMVKLGLQGIGGLAGWLMSLAGIGLIAGGAYSLYKFWKGLKSRG